ncbi:MAG TPA: hypothetical protein VG269_03530, partial [Tepidisphaeraceae bacterium]|nr:hypothetical protein [Tepidisphaeraceae bacterium]
PAREAPGGGYEATSDPSWYGCLAHEPAIVVQAFSLLRTQAQSLHHKSGRTRAGRIVPRQRV